MAIAAGGGGVTIYWKVLTGATVTIAANTQYPVWHRLSNAGTISLAAGAQLIIHN